jgi:hypothetical protein
MQKQPIDREQLRRTPAQFSWLDHRLVRGNYLGRASAPAWGLYLVLVTVGDADGLSYYATRTLARLLTLSEDGLVEARRQLIEAGVIAYAAPLYQVLSLDQGRPTHTLALAPQSSATSPTSPPLTATPSPSREVGA